MSTVVPIGSTRQACHGLRQVAQFNWPFYATAAAMAATGFGMTAALTMPGALRSLVGCAAALAVFWIGSSLWASWYVYDRSALLDATWITPLLGRRPQTWVSAHAGVDDLTPALRTAFRSPGRTLDIFDAAVMMEPSIARARIDPRATDRTESPAERVHYSRLPVETATVDAFVLALAAHELRRPSERAALFREIHRVLTATGRVIVVEHLRDLPNAVVFGPGALHFHSRRTWLRAFTDAGLALERERSMTPFVRIFVLRRSS